MTPKENRQIKRLEALKEIYSYDNQKVKLLNDQIININNHNQNIK